MRFFTLFRHVTALQAANWRQQWQQQMLQQQLVVGSACRAYQAQAERRDEQDNLQNDEHEANLAITDASAAASSFARHQAVWSPARSLPTPEQYSVRVVIRAHDLDVIKAASTAIRDLLLVTFSPKSRAVLPKDSAQGGKVPHVQLVRLLPIHHHATPHRATARGAGIHLWKAITQSPLIFLCRRTCVPNCVPNCVPPPPLLLPAGDAWHRRLCPSSKADALHCDPGPPRGQAQPGAVCSHNTHPLRVWRHKQPGRAYLAAGCPQVLRVLWHAGDCPCQQQQSPAAHTAGGTGCGDAAPAGGAHSAFCAPVWWCGSCAGAGGRERLSSSRKRQRHCCA
jgi:hypothetical protein